MHDFLVFDGFNVPFPWSCLPWNLAVSPSGCERGKPARAVPHHIPVWMGKEGLPGGTIAALGGQGNREPCNTGGGGPRPSLQSWEALTGCRTQRGQRCGHRRPTAGTRTAPQHRCSLASSTTCPRYCFSACHISLLIHRDKAGLNQEGF